jgi:hypothetical protein
MSAIGSVGPPNATHKILCQRRCGRGVRDDRFGVAEYFARSGAHHPSISALPSFFEQILAVHGHDVRDAELPPEHRCHVAEWAHVPDVNECDPVAPNETSRPPRPSKNVGRPMSAPEPERHAVYTSIGLIRRIDRGHRGNVHLWNAIEELAVDPGDPAAIWPKILRQKQCAMVGHRWRRWLMAVFWRLTTSITPDTNFSLVA